jgi:hypothetical protein
MIKPQYKILPTESTPTDATSLAIDFRIVERSAPLVDFAFVETSREPAWLDDITDIEAETALAESGFCARPVADELYAEGSADPRSGVGMANTFAPNLGSSEPDIAPLDCNGSGEACAEGFDCQATGACTSTCTACAYIICCSCNPRGNI